MCLRPPLSFALNLPTKPHEAKRGCGTNHRTCKNAYLIALAQTLQPTALVHEAWLRLAGSENPSFENRAHFFSAAAEAMRRILIDRARRRRSRRHGGGYEPLDLDECDLVAPQADDELLAVHEALDKLAKEYPVLAEVVKLRYFGGRKNQEVAQILEISLTTLKNYSLKTWERAEGCPTRHARDRTFYLFATRGINPRWLACQR